MNCAPNFNPFDIVTIYLEDMYNVEYLYQQILVDGGYVTYTGLFIVMYVEKENLI